MFHTQICWASHTLRTLIYGTHSNLFRFAHCKEDDECFRMGVGGFAKRSQDRGEDFEGDLMVMVLTSSRSISCTPSADRLAGLAPPH